MSNIDVRLASMIWALLTSAAAAAPAQVFVDQGNIKYAGADGVLHALTVGGGYSEPVLGPDGRTVVFIHDEGSGADDADDQRLSSLWIVDGPTETSQRLVSPHHSDDPSQDLDSLQHPAFPPDLRFVYFCATAWATDWAVHRVSLATGKEQFVAAGELISLIQTGPYRNDLLLTRHTFNPATKSFNYPVYVVHPDGKTILRIPDTGDMAKQDERIENWLKARGWRAGSVSATQ